MHKKIQMILRICFLAVIALLCCLMLLSVWNMINRGMFHGMVHKAVPMDADISGLAEQLEENSDLIEIGYEVPDGKEPKDVIAGMFDMVENYSDEAAKLSLHKESIERYMQGQTIKSIRVNFAEPETERVSLEQEYDRMYEEICKKIPDFEKAGDRRKLNAILAYMAKEFSYDEDYDKSQPQLLKRITGSKKIVCIGYSVIIDELCERMDIDCRIITNKTHAWNYVRLDGADAYIQIDGTNKYMPYLISITEFSYQPMEDVRLASVADNCIFWFHSCPLAVFAVIAILLYNFIVEIRGHVYLRRHCRKKSD